MKDEQRIQALEDEVKILKNEVKAVLLDLREQYMNIQNPFNQIVLPGAAAISGVNPEPIAKQADTGAVETGNDVKVITVNSSPETQSKGNQMHASQLPMPRENGDGNNPKTQNEVIESQSVDITEVEESRILALNNMPRLWKEAETNSEEELDEELLTKATALHKKKKKEQDSSVVNSKLDLVVIAGLTQWIDQATAKLGKERTEVLIEMSFAGGRLQESIKDALIRLARLSHYESTSGQSITTSDYLTILAQLENFLAGSKQQDNALLSILSMMKDSGHG